MSATGLPVAEMYSPTYPASAFEPSVNPVINGLKMIGLVEPNNPFPDETLPFTEYCNACTTLDPNPVMLVTGRAIAFVRLSDDGVPRFGVTRDGDVARTIAPLPVGVTASADAIPVPNPLMPVLTGSPAAFVSVNDDGVPSEDPSGTVTVPVNVGDAKWA